MAPNGSGRGEATGLANSPRLLFYIHPQTGRHAIAPRLLVEVKPGKISSKGMSIRPWLVRRLD
jgi:hypothetical protein